MHQREDDQPRENFVLDKDLNKGSGKQLVKKGGKNRPKGLKKKKIKRNATVQSVHCISVNTLCISVYQLWLSELIHR